MLVIIRLGCFKDWVPDGAWTIGLAAERMSNESKQTFRFSSVTRVLASRACSCVSQTMLSLIVSRTQKRSHESGVLRLDQFCHGSSSLLLGYITTIGVDFRFKTIPVDKKTLGLQKQETKCRNKKAHFEGSM